MIYGLSCWEWEQILIGMRLMRHGALVCVSGRCAGEGKEGTSKWYVTIMKKVLEKGDSFVRTESARLKKVGK